jgi:hypothetical protein
MAESQAEQGAATAPLHALQCMEIWGGNRAAREWVSVTGIDAYVFSLPYGGQSSGGDIHYVSLCGGGKIARFAVADVSGHGDAVGRSRSNCVHWFASTSTLSTRHAWFTL